jgi:hypothetical protein
MSQPRQLQRPLDFGAAHFARAARLVALAALAALAACGSQASPSGDAGPDGCAPGSTCGVCQAGARRCDPAAPNVPQTCGTDGTGWTAGAACATDQGLACVDGACVDPCRAASERRSYVGCEYWPVTLRNSRSDAAGMFPFAVAIANPNAVPVTATIDGGALTAAVTRVVPPGAVETVELPWVFELASLRPDTYSMLRRNGAYHLRTTAPVTVYQFNPLTYLSPNGVPSLSGDASLLLPTSGLTRRYTALSYRDADFRQASYVAIVGVGPDDAPTQVAVHLATNINDGPGVAAGAAGTTQTYELRRGDVVELVSDGRGDVTGTTIEASRPVAVFAGHPCTNLMRSSCDHLEEQVPPDETWGRRVAVTQFALHLPLPMVVRIAAQRDETHVDFDPPSVHEPVTLAGRAYLEFQTTRDFVVTSSAPVLVATFMENDGAPLDVTVGDPAMVFEVPVEQYRRDYAFLVPSTFERNFVNIVGPTNAPPMLDGAPPRADPRPVGVQGPQALSVWSVPLGPGIHWVGTPAGTERYAIKVYGGAWSTSYAYPGGMDLQVLPPG